MTQKQFFVSPKAAAAAIALFIVSVRLCTLAFPDLVDTTEGRYAGVAQIMLERDDWVTPWIHYEGINQPYLGKPPLHFWLVQTSFLLFGQNNFAARLPGVISAIGIGAAIGGCAFAVLGFEAMLVTLVVFASSCMTFFLSGAVLLDVTLTLGISLALVSLLLADRSKLASHGIFVGLALGVLTKGPLACILFGCVAVPWSVAHRLLTKSWPAQVVRIPWVTGSLLFLALVIPWYIWAEIRNPGFLSYFIWNENIGRYFSKNYVDEYGSGHRQPFGAGVLMMILATFPWSIILLAVLAPSIKRIFSKRTIVPVLKSDSLLLFALCWTLSCPVLLLGATQYTATYLMPSVSGFALLVALLWTRYRTSSGFGEATLRKILTIATITLLCAWVVISLSSLWFMPNVPIIVASVALALWVAFLCARFVRSPRFLSEPLATQCLGMLMFIALVTSITYGTTTLCFNDHLSANRSSRRVLQVARQLTPAETPLRIGFPFYFPFSAWFYRPLVLGAHDTLVEVKDGDVATAHADLLIIRKRNLERLRKELPNAQEVGAEGQWRIIKP